MKNQIINRTKMSAISVWQLCDQLPKSRSFNAYCNQIIRCSSSVGANYRAACRAKSTADFIYKLKIVEEEADETLYFLELLKEASPEHEPQINQIWKEYNEILSIIISSIKTMKQKNSKI